MFPYYYSNVHHTVEKRASEGFFCVELAKGFSNPYPGPQVVIHPLRGALRTQRHAEAEHERAT